MVQVFWSGKVVKFLLLASVRTIFRISRAWKIINLSFSAFWRSKCRKRKWKFKFSNHHFWLWKFSLNSKNRFDSILMARPPSAISAFLYFLLPLWSKSIITNNTRHLEDITRIIDLWWTLTQKQKLQHPIACNLSRFTSNKRAFGLCFWFNDTVWEILTTTYLEISLLAPGAPFLIRKWSRTSCYEKIFFSWSFRDFVVFWVVNGRFFFWIFDFLTKLSFFIKSWNQFFV